MAWNFVKQHDSEGLAFAIQQFIWLFSVDFLHNPQAVDQTLVLFASNPNPFSLEAYARQAEAEAYVKDDVT